MVWHNLRMYIHESHSYSVLWCTYEYMQYSEKRKSKIFRGSAPWTPGRGSAPAPRQGPLDPTQNRLALTRSLCALRAHVCLPKKKIGSRLRARYVRSAHMFAPQKNRLALTRSLCALRAHVAQKKIGPQQFKKIGSRFALAMCATRTCLPPHNQSLPPSCPPTF